MIYKTEEDERILYSSGEYVGELDELTDQKVSMHDKSLNQAKRVYKLLPTNRIKLPITYLGTRTT